MERKKWTKQEDDILRRHVRAFPHNLSKCFLTVSEQTGRTPAAVASHWYGTLSKKLGEQEQAITAKKPELWKLTLNYIKGLFK